MSEIWVKRPGEEPWLINDSSDLGKVTLQDALNNGCKVVNKEKDDDGEVKFEMLPDDDWTVKEIRKWMTSYNIKFGARDKKAELLEKVANAN